MERAKYLEWCEKVKDRCELYHHSLAKALTEVAGKTEPMTAEVCLKLGIEAQANAELQGFLKEHTQGTAASIVRNNMGGLGLESWRLLSAQFNPRTIRGTLAAQYQESHPKGAAKLSDMPGCLLVWEKK